MSNLRGQDIQCDETQWAGGLHEVSAEGLGNLRPLFQHKASQSLRSLHCLHPRGKLRWFHKLLFFKKLSKHKLKGPLPCLYSLCGAVGRLKAVCLFLVEKLVRQQASVLTFVPGMATESQDSMLSGLSPLAPSTAGSHCPEALRWGYHLG